MKMSIRRGFTVVELVIVVGIVGILAAVVAAGFTSVQKDARDAQVKSGAQKIAEAIELWSLETRLQPRQIGVGNGSSGVMQNNNGVQRCSGAQGNGGGWFGSGSYPCTMEDALVQMGYLDEDLVSSTPPNTKYGTSARSYMLYSCDPIANHWMLFYTLENPTARDEATYTDIAMGQCNRAATIRDSYNMQAVILMDLSPL